MPSTDPRLRDTSPRNPAPTSIPPTAVASAPAGDPVPQWVLDLLLGVAVALVVAIVITADYGGRQDPDPLAYLFATIFGALMLVRRHYPVLVLVITMFVLFAYYTLGYPNIGLAVPVAAALFSAAELGRLTAAVVVSLILIAVSTYFRFIEGETIPYLLGYELASTVTLMATSIALGDSVRSRRALRAEQAQTARLIEQEHARRAEQQIQAERIRMARDLHDVVGHTISVIALQADVAREALGHDEQEARQALRQIRTVSSETMRELRATVKLLRNPEQTPERGVASLANLALLAENARASGLVVEVNSEGDPATLSHTVDQAAYRIIQESLTNVIRHARATRVTLTIAVDEHALRLQVTDNGRSPTGAARPATITPGSGIAGMAERARLLGGTLSAQPLPAGGFAVNAVIPWHAARPRQEMSPRQEEA